MHTHHIMPRHLGGTNGPENLVEVSVEEHAKIHHSLWILGGRWQDKIAWKGLSGLIGKEDMQREISREIGRRNKGRLPWNTGKKRSEETKRKISEANKGGTGRTGYRHSEDTITKIKAARKNQVFSEADREKMRRSRIAYINKMKGK